MEEDKQKKQSPKVNQTDYLSQIHSHSKQFQQLIEKGWRELKEEKKLLEEDKKNYLEITKKLEDVHFAKRIRLNVGGKKFMTSIETLQREPKSFFGIMFSGSWKLELDEEGSYFIDRDGTHFRYILNYLRGGELLLPSGEEALRELKKEVEFYQLHELLKVIKKPLKMPLQGCTLATRQEQQQILNWCSGNNKSWKLLYRASRDGYGAKEFHQQCDGKGETITLIRTTEEYLFGGYASVSWTRQNVSQVTDQYAFLFTLRNKCGTGPTKFTCNSVTYAICFNPSCGPAWGYGGAELSIADNCNQNNCRIGFPSYYADSTLQGCRNFGTSSYFLVKEMEVFCVE
jgi:hypothetical protein